MAKAMPVLLQNCSQFAVEFAGDYLTQDNDQYFPPGTPNANQPNPDWGRIKRIGPDGVVDYVVDHSAVTASNYNVSSKIRWYGLPRDTNGDRRSFPAMLPIPVSRARDLTWVSRTPRNQRQRACGCRSLSDVIATLTQRGVLRALSRELPSPRLRRLRLGNDQLQRERQGRLPLHLRVGETAAPR
jgi:hypothetical protein